MLHTVKCTWFEFWAQMLRNHSATATVISMVKCGIYLSIYSGKVLPTSLCWFHWQHLTTYEIYYRQIYADTRKVLKQILAYLSYKLGIFYFLVTHATAYDFVYLWDVNWLFCVTLQCHILITINHRTRFKVQPVTQDKNTDISPYHHTKLLSIPTNIKIYKMYQPDKESIRVPNKKYSSSVNNSV